MERVRTWRKRAAAAGSRSAQFLADGVVAGQPVELAAAEQVDGRVADVGDDQVVGQAQRQRQGRPHVPQARLALGLGADRLVHRPGTAGPSGSITSASRCVLPPQDPVGRLEGEFDEQGDGHPAGDLAGRVPAHPVGDGEPVAGRAGLLRGVTRRAGSTGTVRRYRPNWTTWKLSSLFGRTLPGCVRPPTSTSRRRGAAPPGGAPEVRLRVVE